MLVSDPSLRLTMVGGDHRWDKLLSILPENVLYLPVVVASQLMYRKEVRSFFVEHI